MPVTPEQAQNSFPGLASTGADARDIARIVNNILTGGLNVVGFLDKAAVIAEGSPCVVLDPHVNRYSVILFTPFVNASIKDLTVTNIDEGQFTIEWDTTGHPSIDAEHLRYAVFG